MLYKILFSLIFLSQLSFAQTKDHVNVPGTKCSIIPPEGFEPAMNFSGFQNIEMGASIMINEVPAPYAQLEKGFTAESLKTKGMILVNRKQVDHNNGKGSFFTVTQSANGTTYIKQILMFGDANVTVLVNGIYPEASRSLEGKITEAILSTVYTPTQNENPLDAAPFTVNTEGSEFKVVKYMSGNLLYSADGRIPTDKPTLIVGNSLVKVSPSDRQQYARERLKKLPRGEYNQVKEVKEITVDGMKGYEIVADGKSKEDIAELVYLSMLFDEKGNYYLIIGQAKENFVDNLETFKRIARTFKRK